MSTVPNYVNDVVMPWVNGDVRFSPYFFASLMYLESGQFRSLPREYSIRIEEFAQAVTQIQRIDDVLVEMRRLLSERSNVVDLAAVPAFPDSDLLNLLHAGFNRLPNCSRDMCLLAAVLTAFARKEAVSARADEVTHLCNLIQNLYVCFAESTGLMAARGSIGVGYMSQEGGMFVLYYLAKVVDLSEWANPRGTQPHTLN